MMEDEPIERHLHSRESLTRWLNDKHNRVNQKLGTQIMPYPVYVTRFCSDHRGACGETISNTIQQPFISQGAQVGTPAGRWGVLILVVLLAAGLFFGLTSLKRKSHGK